MWIVRLALNRPRMVAVMAILIALLGVLSITRTPTDILPAVNIPVVDVIWQYGGLSPQEMEGRVVRVSEAVITTVVSNVEHVAVDPHFGRGPAIVGLLWAVLDRAGDLVAADAGIDNGNAVAMKRAQASRQYIGPAVIAVHGRSRAVGNRIAKRRRLQMNLPATSSPRHP